MNAKYFDESEQVCKCCGMGADKISPVLLNRLDRLRETYGKPIYVSCMYRCPDHNAKVGGVSNSQHVLGAAADIYVDGDYEFFYHNSFRRMGHGESCGCLQKELMRDVPSRAKKENTYVIENDVVYLYDVNQNCYIIDAEDLPRVKGLYFRKFRKGYAIATLRGLKAKKNVFLHRYIMDCSEGMVVDHIDHNVFNNRKSNLRICTIAENTYNRANVKGVKQTSSGKWLASIFKDGKNYRLGLFDTEQEALWERKQAELRFFGEFACNA